MDGLNVTNNQVVLGIKAGRGFAFLNKSFIIEASLNGHTLETDLLQPSNEITIGAELLWEAEKKVLKRLRTGNVPLKVECFAVVNGQKQEKVGYILLTLRAAKTIPANSTFSDIPGTWHSFLGVKSDVKLYNPSLLLNLCIEDISITDTKSATKAHDVTTYAPLSKYIPQLSSNKDMVQIGHCKTSDSTFLLSVFLESTTDLHLLAESEHETSGNFTFFCVIMGCTKQGRTISKLSSLTLDTNNKFAVKVSGSLQNLRDYFQERELGSIKITSSGQDIAYGKINGSCLISVDELQTLHSQCSLNYTFTTRSRCYLMKSSTHQIPVSATGSNPYVDAVIKLQYLCADRNKGIGQGDADSCSNVHLPCEPTNLCANISWNLKDTNISDEEDGLQEVQCTMQEWFALNLTVESILVHKASCVDKLFFRFHHTKATVVLKHYQEVTIDKTNYFVPVHGVVCSLYLQGSLKDVQYVLSMHKPTIQILTIVDRDYLSCANGEVDISQLHKEKTDCSSVVRLMDTSQDSEFGMIKLQMTLEKVMIMNREKHQKNPFSESNIISSPGSDSAERPAKEIEEWKEQQRELFMAELKRKELECLDAVVEDWEKRQKEYEIALNDNVQHCTELAASLSCATDELRTKSQIIAQKETEISHIQSTLEVEYQAKLQECREASRRMEDDFKLEISKLQVENKRLFDQIALQEEESARLLKITKDQENELERLKRNTLTEDQTAALLKELKLTEEKYEIAYRSKIFFKEQWARAMREIHTIKFSHREEINTQIKCNKEELRTLGRMLPPCEAAHRSHPATAAAVAAAEDGDSSERTDKKDATDDLEKSTLELKLQELVQERDSLLNTGTYALDHALITKLNKQIRILLAESNHKFVYD